MRYNYNEGYFRNWSHNMAYILGYIVADGCVSLSNGSYGLIISSVDLDTVTFIKDEICATKNIYHNGDGSHTISFTNKNLIMDIMAHGVIPRKTWAPVVPEVPIEYWISFIHGLFDGDGSSYIIKLTRDVTIRIGTSISSHNKEFLMIIGNMIRHLIGNIPKIYPSYLKDRECYRLMYQVKESIAFYHMLYDKPNITYFLNRKKEVYEDWLINIKNDINWGFRLCVQCGKKFVALHDNSNRCWQCRNNNCTILNSNQDMIQNYKKL